MAIAAAIVVSWSMVSAQEITLEEIVVTAQKREETVQDVPIAVSAYDRESLRDMGAETINDLGPYTPGLETNITDFTQPTFTIRGIQANDFGIGTDPAVAVYLDGVYVGRSGSTMLHFNDIERVEVLRGPQGTLFGRNAAAGAISIITNKPHDQTKGEMGITVGNYNKAKAEGVFNTAVAEDLFFRCGLLYNQRDGYIENAAPGADDLADEGNGSGVGAFLWTPTVDTEVTWRLEYIRFVNDLMLATYGVGIPGVVTDEQLLGDFFRDRLSNDLTLDSFAVFGDLTHDVTENFRATVGLRYTHDRKEFERHVEANEFGYSLAFPYPNGIRLDAAGLGAALPDPTVYQTGFTDNLKKSWHA